MATTPSNEFGVYKKPGHDDRYPLDQAEVNELIWQGYQPAGQGKTASSSKADDKA